MTLARFSSGSGRIAISRHAQQAVISELSSTYPLKLLSPPTSGRTALVYLLTYGGGLVYGDEINLDVVVNDGGCLLLLSQGTTKVFKIRRGLRLSSVHTTGLPKVLPVANDISTPTKQNLRFQVGPGSVLLLLPEPVTCFRDASYHQNQIFNILGDGSAVILDWITSGRMSVGEEWAFSRYYSANEIFHDGKRVAKDVMLLDDVKNNLFLPARTLPQRLWPYACYASLVLFGPKLESIILKLSFQYKQISVFKKRNPPELIWSLSPLATTNTAVILRIAGLETENVKRWIKASLSSLEEIVGKDTYKCVFP